MIVDIINIALDAGEKVLEIYRGDISVELKEDNTPVTEADKRANEIICEGLKRLDPNYHILSEENKNIEYERRREWKYVWLVDPLDGTKEFISGRGEFTINIALVSNSEPILGVVYAPVLKTVYFAVKGEGAYRLDNVKSKISEDDIKRAKKLPSEKTDGGKVRIVASRSHMNRATEQFIERIKSRCEEVEIVSVGSALKMCIVAEAKADLYPRLGPTMEWDTAAGHIIALEGGCEVRIYNGNISGTLAYNKKDLVNPPFVVFRKEKAYLLD